MLFFLSHVERIWRTHRRNAMTTGNYHFVLKTWHHRSSCIGKCNQIDEIVIAERVKYGVHRFYGQFE